MLTFSHPPWGFRLSSKSRLLHWFLGLFANRLRFKKHCGGGETRGRVCVLQHIHSYLPDQNSSFSISQWDGCMLETDKKKIQVFTAAKTLCIYRNIDCFLHISPLLFCMLKHNCLHFSFICCHGNVKTPRGTRSTQLDFCQLMHHHAWKEISCAAHIYHSSPGSKDNNNVFKPKFLCKCQAEF